MVSPEEASRFWSKVNKSEGCWEWIAYRKNTGYGRLRFKSRTTSAHRVSALLAGLITDIDDEKCVLHKCDNPSCVNPGHLFVGTQLDNIKDRDMKHRTKTPALRGEKHGMATLSDAQVADIRQRYASRSIRQAALAREFGVQPNTISRIVNYKRR